MKKKMLLVVLLGFTSLLVIAQCDKKVTWNSSRAELLDTSGTVVKTFEEKVSVITSKTDLIMTKNDNAEDTMTGTVKDLTCNWKEAYKNGKTTFKTILSKSNGDSKEAFVTIEGKDGKVTIQVKIVELNMNIRIVADNYKETGE